LEEFEEFEEFEEEEPGDTGSGAGLSIEDPQFSEKQLVTYLRLILIKEH
jgi:hypothetical protein